MRRPEDGQGASSLDYPYLYEGRYFTSSGRFATVYSEVELILTKPSSTMMG